MTHGELFSFGPYLLDTTRKTLSRDGESLSIAQRQFDVLAVLISRAGQVVSKDELTDAAWGDVAVGDHSIEQAIFLLRQKLTLLSGEPCIETYRRRGYRFTASVSRVARVLPDSSIDHVLSTHRAWIEGRAALETLETGAIVRARAVFADVVRKVPGQASAHVGLANACALQFEMTRADPTPDTAALALAATHAQEAVRLDPKYGEAWATLGFVLERNGRREDALAAARESIVLEPDNWRHHLRLSAASWGEERLREARRTLTLLPGLALAHWLAASVLVARQALGEAERELVAGIAGQQEGEHQGRFSGIALHWLLGLIALASGDTDRAILEFDRELRCEHGGHLYAREMAANTWYAIAATRLRQGDDNGARFALEECRQRIPGHPLARATLGIEVPAAGVTPIDAALARAVACAARREGEGCAVEARRIEGALREAPPGNAAWLLPVEPMLGIQLCPTPWLGALAGLRGRAS